MFKKFSKEDVTGSSQVKTSVLRNIRNSIITKYPAIEPYMDDIWPKKHPVVVAKCKEHVSIVAINQEAAFFNLRDGDWCPTLRLLHQYPFILPRYQVDKGAIKYVMSGAQIMCPGLTSPGGAMEDVLANTFVVIMAEGKEHALGIGFTKMSSQEIRTVNKGPGVDNVHYLNDGLWTLEKIA